MITERAMARNKMAYVSILIICCVISLSSGEPQEQLTNYENLYELGMEAYKDGKWKKCTQYFNNALKAYKYYKGTVIDCRLKCQKEFAQPTEPSFENVFHGVLLTSNCLRRCKKLNFGQSPDLQVSYLTDKKFEERLPYNYLQFCYFKLNKLKKAAAAAFTYYITHQDEAGILETLQYYRSLPEIDRDDFIDKERLKYQKSYVVALEAYNDGEWEVSATNFQKALSQYYTEEERCRAGCERGFTHNDFPDFVNAIADHYVAVIVCKQKCLQKLSTFGMQQLDNFVADQYNYLQYAYYESKNLKKAFESIANYLVFKPTDHEMVANKDYYIKTLRHKEEEFVPSQEVLDYAKMWTSLDNSLDFVRESYILPRDSIQNDPEDEHLDVRSSILQSFTKLGVEILEDFKYLNKEPRYVIDGVIREDQCQAIADLARSQDQDETGVRQIDVSKAMALVKTDNDYEISLRLMLRESEMITAFTYVYFNQSRMYMKESKVVCRSAGDHCEEKLAKDCVPQEDGTCMGSGDTSEYMVISYLTDISDDTGQFYFMDENKEVQYRVSPKCGLVIGFAGNLMHGVNQAVKQDRCAIVTYLSLDQEQLSPGVKEAKELLKELEKEHVKQMKEEDRDGILDMFYEQGVKVAKTGEDLLGKERFAADGLSTQAECTELIKLAKNAAESGDGYHGNAYPLSEGEVFTGLSVKSAEKGMLQGDGYQVKGSHIPARFISPYSKSENFEGLNVSRALKLIDMDEASAYPLQLLLDLSDHSRLMVEKYFNLTKPLYFDYTHLVCRTAVEGYEREAEDLSHPVHSDNCMIQDDGSCLVDKLAYVQRHYSAILYLNNDFEGGEFFFAHQNKSEQVSVEPQCGRLVAFNAGEYHGVKSVLKGQRCAIAMWYTHDPNYIEAARMHAQRKLDTISIDKKFSDSGRSILPDAAIPPEPFTMDTEDHDEL